jgi:hypothetical protein
MHLEIMMCIVVPYLQIEFHQHKSPKVGLTESVTFSLRRFSLVRLSKVSYDISDIYKMNILQT